MDSHTYHVLIVPPTGLLEILQSDQPIDVARQLLLRGSGVPVRLELMVDDTPQGHLWMLAEPTPTQTENPRAASALSTLTGVHVAMNGPVAFTEIPEPLMADLVAALS